MTPDEWDNEYKAQLLASHQRAELAARAEATAGRLPWLSPTFPLVQWIVALGFLAVLVVIFVVVTWLTHR